MRGHHLVDVGASAKISLPKENIRELVEVYAKYAADHGETEKVYKKVVAKLKTKMGTETVKALMPLIHEQARPMYEDVGAAADDDDEEYDLRRVMTKSKRTMSLI